MTAGRATVGGEKYAQEWKPNSRTCGFVDGIVKGWPKCAVMSLFDRGKRVIEIAKMITALLEDGRDR